MIIGYKYIINNYCRVYVYMYKLKIVEYKYTYTYIKK